MEQLSESFVPVMNSTHVDDFGVIDRVKSWGPKNKISW